MEQIIMKKGSIKKYATSSLFALAGGVCFFLVSQGIFQSIVMSIIFYFIFLLNYERETQKKTDKGFELFYKNLSYRRKFIRNMWLLPVTLIVVALLWFVPSYELWRKITISLILLGIAGIALLHSHAKWKKENANHKA